MRCQSLSRFSLMIALSVVGCASYQTSVWTPYILVNPSTKSFLCCQTRCTRSEVTPMYRVPLRLLARMYTQGILSVLLRGCGMYLGVGCDLWVPASAGTTGGMPERRWAHSVHVLATSMARENSTPAKPRMCSMSRSSIRRRPGRPMTWGCIVSTKARP